MTNTVKCEVIKTEKYIEDNGLVITYGLVYKNDQDILTTVEDVSCNYQFVCSVAKKVESNDVSVIHLIDIIEDELTLLDIQ